MDRCDRCGKEALGLVPSLLTTEQLCFDCRAHEDRGMQGAAVSRQEAAAWREWLNPPRVIPRRDGVHIYR